MKRSAGIFVSSEGDYTGFLVIFVRFLFKKVLQTVWHGFSCILGADTLKHSAVGATPHHPFNQ